MLACSDHGQWAVLEGLATGQQVWAAQLAALQGMGLARRGWCGKPTLSYASLVVYSPAPVNLLPVLSLLSSLAAVLMLGCLSEPPYPTGMSLELGKSPSRGSSSFPAQDTSLLHILARMVAYFFFK